MVELKLPEGDRSLYPHEVKQAKEEMGTLASYTDDWSFREWLGQTTRYWDPNTYRLAKSGQPIKIYRAVPLEVTEIHPGAYVTQSRAYAQMHLESVLRGQGHILEGQARADELIPINPNEFYYAPVSASVSASPEVIARFPAGQEPEKVKVDQLELPIPPVKGREEVAGYPYANPRVISMKEYNEVWKPAGWNLIIIGPTSTWRQEWTEWEAIRDIVQNALDEAEMYEWGYDREGLWIRDQGKGIAVADFLLGPPKLKPDWARGKFGEGMKIACLALLRKGWPVRVETVGREIQVIFLEQEVDGKAETLAALWKPDGTRLGTTFRIIGYTGPAFEDRFTQNLPDSAFSAQAPSRITTPVQRFNQLIEYTFPKGSRIYARDIYMRDINSLFSYNLWGFDLAPDRFGPKNESDMWVDMGRLWSCVNDVRLLTVFLEMVRQPPVVETEESHNINMDSWAMGRMPDTDELYAEMVKHNRKAWQQAWAANFGENAVIRTSDRWDGIVKHLGYVPISVQWYVRDTLAQAIKTDVQLKDESQERLREVEVIPDDNLTPRQRACLALARKIVSGIARIRPVKGVHAAIIPPASDRVRTAGMYSRTTEEIYISSDMLDSGRNTVDTTIHELAHHTSGAEDGEEAHNAEMPRLAALVVGEASFRAYDDIIGLPDFRW